MTTKTTKITRDFLRAINDDLAKAIKAIGEKHGCTLSIGRGTYDDSTAKLAIHIALPDADGNARTKDAIAFERDAFVFGFEPSDLGREFAINGSHYAIAGLKPRSPRFPIIARDVSTGKLYKFPANTVKFALTLGTGEKS